MAASSSPHAVVVHAFAKINLSLHVLGVREDGFHALRTTFQSLALHDTLRLTPRPGPFAISCDSPSCPVDERNLVWTAATRIWRAAGRAGDPRDVAVRLTKRIPQEAGLGGGSSDAAAAMRGFRALWRPRIAAARFETIAAGLGADVPYFLTGGTALGLNRGDAIRALPDEPAAWVLLVLPGYGVSTRDAFGWWDSDTDLGRRHPSGPPDEVRNDLEGPVAARHPDISLIVRALGRAGAARAAMSGSGSTVYGVFTDRGSAETAAAALGRTWRTTLTRTISRLRYEARSAPRVLPGRGAIV